MARTEAMAQIETLLVPTGTTPPPPPAETKEEKRERLKAEKQTEKDLKIQEEARLKAAKEEEEQQEEAQNTLIEQAKNAGQMGLDLWKNLQTGVSQLPAPGGIILPLSILLIFFFLLLPVNGHTRAMWLWLVITGQADIIGGFSSGTFGSPEPTATPNEPVTLNAPTRQGTYAEDGGIWL